MKGQGIAREETKGDLICTVKIVVPKDLSDADKDLIRTLQTRYPMNPRAALGG